MSAIGLMGNEVQELYKNDAIKQLSLKLKAKQGKSVSKSLDPYPCQVTDFLVSLKS